ncbi:hypothetical protein D9613_007565 [Agrocybe pediades]|uniref:Protein-S-isoprenylcysteine O-methyltransferase n=1 Tax=Agrocybe pediades TaxID=84607 RepID=A0A8H4QLU4_9AGAR|nr:hypothetical protein D9613_007565 [Agrocybe pediades]
MSLSKIPVIVLVTVAFKVMLTAPTPPAADNEIVQNAAPLDIKKLRENALRYAHVVQILLAIVEIATILSTSGLLPADLSRLILSTCVFDKGHPERIGITYISLFGAILWICGALLRFRTYNDLGSFFRYDVSIQKDHKLITSGAYAYVRHPSYTGITIAVLGWFMWNFTEGSWIRESALYDTTLGRVWFLVHAIGVILPTSLVTLLRIPSEDAALKKTFGKEWEEWARRVPYAVIPGVY